VYCFSWLCSSGQVAGKMGMQWVILKGGPCCAWAGSECLFWAGGDVYGLCLEGSPLGRGIECVVLLSLAWLLRGGKRCFGGFCIAFVDVITFANWLSGVVRASSIVAMRCRLNVLCCLWHEWVVLILRRIAELWSVLNSLILCDARVFILLRLIEISSYRITLVTESSLPNIMNVQDLE
jgi:hypothetical protein